MCQIRDVSPVRLVTVFRWCLMSVLSTVLAFSSDLLLFFYISFLKLSLHYMYYMYDVYNK